MFSQCRRCDLLGFLRNEIRIKITLTSICLFIIVRDTFVVNFNGAACFSTFNKLVSRSKKVSFVINICNDEENPQYAFLISCGAPEYFVFAILGSAYIARSDEVVMHVINIFAFTK